MTHRKWTPGALMAKAYRDITEEHNATVDAWQQAAADVDRLAAINGDLCDEIAALRGSIHVPFSDAQIEKMAKAHMGVISPCANWEHADKQYYMNAIRAALAAGGLEPCAVPLNTERASDEELEHVYEQGREFGELVNLEGIRAVRARVEAPLLAEIQRLKSEPTGHVLRERLENAERIIENQRISQRQLHEAVERDAVERMKLESEFVSLTAERDKARAELEAVKAERDKAVDERNQHIKREYTSWETEFRKVEAERDELKKSSELLSVVYKGEMDARKSAQSELAALRQRDAVPVKVRFDVTAALVEEVFSAGDWAEYSWQAVMDYIAAHAVIDAPAGVPSVDELMRIGEWAYENTGADCCEGRRNRAAAIRDAVLVGVAGERESVNDELKKTNACFAARNEELALIAEILKVDRADIVDEIHRLKTVALKCEVGHICAPSQMPVWLGPTRAQAEAKWEECKDLWDSGQEYSDWLLPLLPESAPVGVELDVTADVIEVIARSSSRQTRAKEILDLCRSRIKPVYECK